jgi:hypothetical protein
VLECRFGSFDTRLAGVAQLVEQLIRNQQVVRSTRIAGSIFPRQTTDSLSATAPLRLLGNIWVTAHTGAVPFASARCQLIMGVEEVTVAESASANWTALQPAAYCRHLRPLRASRPTKMASGFLKFLRCKTDRRAREFAVISGAAWQPCDARFSRRHAQPLPLRRHRRHCIKSATRCICSRKS